MHTEWYGRPYLERSLCKTGRHRRSLIDNRLCNPIPCTAAKHFGNSIQVEQSNTVRSNRQRISKSCTSSLSALQLENQISSRSCRWKICQCRGDTLRQHVANNRPSNQFPFLQYYHTTANPSPPRHALPTPEPGITSPSPPPALLLSAGSPPESPSYSWASTNPSGTHRPTAATMWLQPRAQTSSSQARRCSRKSIIGTRRGRAV